MLCSISAGKSSSNWLDRLRSSKGFPAGNDLDLEQFLSHLNPNICNSQDNKVTDSTTNNIDLKSGTNSTVSNKRTVLDRKQTTEIPRENGDKEWFGVMTNVLAELFYMGDSKDFSRINGKKSSRKQPNPKICVVSTSMNVNDMSSDNVRRDEGVLGTSRSSDDKSSVEIKFTSDQRKLTEQEDLKVSPVDAEEEEKSHADLSSFSRTEVTVIDTSCPSWKFEKILFRKKNVWKVRDKKCKAINIGRKKRKANPLNDNAGGEKKPKLYIGQCSSSKNANAEEGMVPSYEGHDLSKKMEEACKGEHDILRQVPKKRFPRKLKKGGSSVILIKSIPTSKINRPSIPKGCLKPTQRQQYKA